jgi:probable rRNA maturation factor
MKCILEVNNKTKYKFSKTFFTRVFKHSLELAKVDYLQGKTLELSIAIVDEEEMTVLNQQYRKKNRATDVLSFCEYESLQEIHDDILGDKKELIFLGELILCPMYIERNAKEDGESLEFATTYITAHGVYHLLGFNHGRKMFTMQQNVANQLSE